MRLLFLICELTFTRRTGGIHFFPFPPHPAPGQPTGLKEVGPTCPSHYIVPLSGTAPRTQRARKRALNGLSILTPSAIFPLLFFGEQQLVVSKLIFH
jgi:hypothetical protein